MSSAASEANQRRARQQQEKDALTNKEVITSLMSVPSGRRWVWLRLAEARMFAEDESLDPQLLAYRQGQRNLGLRLLKAAQGHCPEMYVRMTQENSGVAWADPAEEQEED